MTELLERRSAEDAEHRLNIVVGLLQVLRNGDETATLRAMEAAAKIVEDAPDDPVEMREALAALRTEDELILQEVVANGGGTSTADRPTPGAALSARGQQRPKGRGRKKKPAPGEPGSNEFERQHPRGRAGRWIEKGEGMKEEPSDRVRQLQQRLRELGFTLDTDGRFGVHTEEAVKAFQRKYGLKETGKVDASTVETLRNPPPKTATQARAEIKEEEGDGKGTSSKGGKDSGGGRSERRRSRSSSGSRISLEGKGKAEIEKFQREHGLKVTGKLDDATRGAVSALNAREKSADRDKTTRGGGQEKSRGGGLVRRGDGMRGEADASVRKLQEQLEALGFELGEGGVDGRFGEDTERAVRMLQRRYGLRVDGVVGPQTAKMIQRLLKRQKKEAEEQGYLSVDQQEGVSGRSRKTQESAALHTEEETVNDEMQEARNISGTQQPYGGWPGTVAGHEGEDAPLPFSREPEDDVLFGSEAPRMPPGLREAPPWQFARCASCVHHDAKRLCMLYSAGTGLDELCDSWYSLTPEDARGRIVGVLTARSELTTARESADGNEIVRAKAHLDHALHLLEASSVDDPEFEEVVHGLVEKGRPRSEATEHAKKLVAKKRLRQAEEGVVALMLAEAEEHHRLKCPKCGHVQYADNKKCSNCGHDLAEARKAKFAQLKESGVLQEAVLTAQQRKNLSKSDFAIPEKKAYPIHDEAHARNALARVSQHGSPEEQKRVRAAVCRRYPKMCKNDNEKRMQEAGWGYEDQSGAYWLTEATFTEEARKKLAKEGKAMGHGGYPIRNETDLKKAIQAFGRAKNKAATKRWIIKRAKALGKTALLPEGWLQEATASVSAPKLVEVKSSAYPDLERSPRKNWVEKAGGLPKYIERIAKHLHYEKGMPIGRAIAVAVNVVKKMCASGELNFPGRQSANPKSRAQACAAVASWEKKKASAKLKEALALVEAAEQEDGHAPYLPLEECLELVESMELHEARHPLAIHFDPRLHPRNRLGQFRTVLRAIERGGRGAEVTMPHGVTVRRRAGGAFTVHQGGRRKTGNFNIDKAARSALKLSGFEVEDDRGAIPFGLRTERYNIAFDPGDSEVFNRAFDDWNSGRAYLGNDGNYRMKDTGQIAPWNRPVKERFPTRAPGSKINLPGASDFSDAARGRADVEAALERNRRARRAAGVVDPLRGDWKDEFRRQKAEAEVGLQAIHAEQRRQMELADAEGDLYIHDPGTGAQSIAGLRRVQEEYRQQIADPANHPSNKRAAKRYINQIEKMIERASAEGRVGPLDTGRKGGGAATAERLTVTMGERPQEFQKGDRVVLADGRMGTISHKSLGGSSALGGEYREPEYTVTVHDPNPPPGRRGYGIEYGVTHSSLRYQEEELAARREKIETLRTRAEKPPVKRAMPTFPAGVTIQGQQGSSAVPDEWQVEHGYAEWQNPRYTNPREGERVTVMPSSSAWSDLTGQKGTVVRDAYSSGSRTLIDVRMDDGTVKQISNQVLMGEDQKAWARLKPGTNVERMLYHYLAGKPPPANFPQGSEAHAQWSYKGAGKKDDRIALIRKLTGMTLREVALVLGWTPLAEHPSLDDLALVETTSLAAVRLPVAELLVEARNVTGNLLVEAAVEVLRDRLRKLVPEPEVKLQEARDARRKAAGDPAALARADGHVKLYETLEAALL